MFPAVLQIGIPGGPELLIIFMIMFMFGIPVVLAALAGLYFWRKGSDDGDAEPRGAERRDQDRIEELEREVAELREELAAARADDEVEEQG